MKTNFEGEIEFHIPVIFIEGKHDYHVSCALVKNYFDTINTDKQLHWFEQSGHYPQWEEPDKFNQIMISLLESKTR